MNHIRECLNCQAPDCDPSMCPLLEHPKKAVDARDWRRYERDVMLTAHGESHTMREWAKITGMSYMTIYMRIWRGWTHEDAVSKSLHPYRGRKRKGKGTDEHSEQHRPEDP